MPENYVLKNAEDFDKYQEDVIKTIDWIMNTPINKSKSERKDANAFIMNWISGSPKLSITVGNKITDDFMNENNQYLMIFMAGWTQYAIEDNEYSNALKGNIKGIESLIKFYQKNRDFVEKSNAIEKFIKMQKKGTLEEFVKKNM